MAVKIFIKRRIKTGDLHRVSEMLIKARTNAMGEQGYISSETLRGCDDPDEILVISLWETKEDWERYTRKPSRKELEAGFSELLESPAVYAAYNLGIQQ